MKTQGKTKKRVDLISTCCLNKSQKTAMKDCLFHRPRPHVEPVVWNTISFLPISGQMDRASVQKR